MPLIFDHFFSNTISNTISNKCGAKWSFHHFWMLYCHSRLIRYDLFIKYLFSITYHIASKQQATKKPLSNAKRFINFGWKMGFEPTTFGTTIRHSNRLSYIHHLDLVSQIGCKYNILFSNVQIFLQEKCNCRVKLLQM